MPVYSLTFGKAVARVNVAIIHVHDEDSLVAQEVSLVSISLLVKETQHIVMVSANRRHTQSEVESNNITYKVNEKTQSDALSRFIAS